LIAPAVFLHFCLTFPEAPRWLARRESAIIFYIPAVLLFMVYLGFSSGVLSVAVPLVQLRWLLDRIWVVLSTLPYLIGGVVLSFQ
jgi:two-component system, NtrC family, sensor kinase